MSEKINVQTDCPTFLSGPLTLPWPTKLNRRYEPEVYNRKMMVAENECFLVLNNECTGGCNRIGDLWMPAVGSNELAHDRTVMQHKAYFGVFGLPLPAPDKGIQIIVELVCGDVLPWVNSPLHTPCLALAAEGNSSIR